MLGLAGWLVIWREEERERRGGSGRKKPLWRDARRLFGSNEHHDRHTKGKESMVYFGGIGVFLGGEEG